MKNLILILLLLIVGVVRADEIDDLIHDLNDDTYLVRQIARLKLETDLKPSVIAKIKEARKNKELQPQVKIVFQQILDKYYDVESNCADCPIPDISWMPLELDPLGLEKEKYHKEAETYYSNQKWPLNFYAKPDPFERSRLIGMWATQFFIRDKLDDGMRKEDVSRLLDMFVLNQYATENELYNGIEIVDLVHKFVVEQWEKIQEHGKVK